MRVVFLLSIFMMVLCACSPNVQIPAETFQPPAQIEEEAIVTLRFSQPELNAFVDKEAEIWRQARATGLAKVFYKILDREVVFHPAVGLAMLGQAHGAYTQKGAISSQKEAETGDLIQTFEVSTVFVGDPDLGGHIIVQEGNRYISSTNDVVYAMLLALPPQSPPLYVAIAKPVAELGPGFLRLAGMAEIKQVMGAVKSQGQDGTLCALNIVGSDREIEAGDQIFLLSVAVIATNDEGLDTSPLQKVTSE